MRQITELVSQEETWAANGPIISPSISIPGVVTYSFVQRM
jgi:hypothetical protein